MRSYRARNGSAIAEFGPALVILFVFIAFPMLAVLGMGAQYACAWYHNHLMLEELSERTSADGGVAAGANPGTGATAGPTNGFNVHSQIVSQFDSTGMATFSGAIAPGFVDSVMYYGPTAVLPARVTCSTTLTARPFISIPMLGFDHMTFSIMGDTTREVTQ